MAAGMRCICFASGAHAIPPRFVLADASAPERVEDPPRAGIIGQPAIPIAGVLSRGREWDISGSQTMRPVPLPRSKIPYPGGTPCARTCFFHGVISLPQQDVGRLLASMLQATSRRAIFEDADIS
jgi:hypothetical protein